MNISNQWENIDNQLVRSFKFANFTEALKFTNLVGEIAEKLHHHPTITLTWGKVTIFTCTHDAGNSITGKDRELASEIDKISEHGI